MNLYLLRQYQFIQDLYQNESYLNILMNIDDFFDILNIYAFPNWIDSEIIGVKCMKHFTNIILKQSRDKMPHPKAGVVLTKYDCIVKYKKTNEWLPKQYKGFDDIVIDEKTGKKRAKMEKKPIWVVDILIPNRLLINDDVYDINAIQKKLDAENDDNEELGSMVSNEETVESNNQQG